MAYTRAQRIRIKTKYYSSHISNIYTYYTFLNVFKRRCSLMMLAKLAQINSLLKKKNRLSFNLQQRYHKYAIY